MSLQNDVDQKKCLLTLRLTSSAGVYRGKEVKFSKRQIIIGRAEECDIRPSCFEVSRRHSEININQNGDVWVRDLGSANGTFVGTKELSEPQQLQTGDVVGIGTLFLEVVLPEEDETIPNDSSVAQDDGSVLTGTDDSHKGSQEKASASEVTSDHQIDLDATAASAFAENAPLRSGAPENRSEGRSGNDYDAAAGATHASPTSGKNDLHGIALTRQIGNAIEDFRGKHPEVSPAQVGVVLQQLHDAMTGSVGSSGQLKTQPEVPKELAEAWSKLPSEIHTAILSIVKYSVQK